MDPGRGARTAPVRAMTAPYACSYPPRPSGDGRREREAREPLFPPGSPTCGTPSRISAPSRAPAGDRRLRQDRKPSIRCVHWRAPFMSSRGPSLSRSTRAPVPTPGACNPRCRVAQPGSCLSSAPPAPWAFLQGTATLDYCGLAPTVFHSCCAAWCISISKGSLKRRSFRILIVSGSRLAAFRRACHSAMPSNVQCRR